MNRSNIIILHKQYKEIDAETGENKLIEIFETWGSLSEICKVYGYVYNTIKWNKFPFHHDGWHFVKVPFRQKAINNVTSM